MQLHVETVTFSARLSHNYLSVDSFHIAHVCVHVSICKKVYLQILVIIRPTRLLPVHHIFSMVITEMMFTKSMPSQVKMKVKGGAAVDPDSGKDRLCI